MSPVPAQLLRSVAMRYDSPLCASSPNAPVQQRSWRSAQTDQAIRLEPEQPIATGTDVNNHSLRRDAEMSRLEAILLLAREPLNSRKLAQYANLVDGTQARTLVRRLNERYDAAGRAFRVQQVAGGYQLRSRRAFAPWLRRLAHVPGESRLSAPALETLAVIAYRQPVPRAEIEAIRGVNCGEILRQLMERDLVRVGGRSEELGRPFLYATTKRFLELFGLIHLDELPRGDLLRHAPLPAAGPPVTILAEPAGDETWPACDTSDENLSDEYLSSIDEV